MILLSLVNGDFMVKFLTLNKSKFVYTFLFNVIVLLVLAVFAELNNSEEIFEISFLLNFIAPFILLFSLVATLLFVGVSCVIFVLLMNMLNSPNFKCLRELGFTISYTNLNNSYWFSYPNYIGRIDKYEITCEPELFATEIEVQIDVDNLPIEYFSTIAHQYEKGRMLYGNGIVLKYQNQKIKKSEPDFLESEIRKLVELLDNLNIDPL